MFYQYRNGLKEVTQDEITEDVLTVGYLSCDELQECYEKFGFAAATAEACRTASNSFRSGVEVHDVYTFTELRIYDPSNDEQDDDCVALYVKKNLIIVVDVEDHDGSTKRKLLNALGKYNENTILAEKILFSFFEQLMWDNARILEQIGGAVSELEETMLDGSFEKDFNITLFGFKKKILLMRNYYEQILDITEAFEENENDIFDEEKLIYISNITSKVSRLKDDADTVRGSVVQLQEAYSANLDVQMNRTMKVLTVITTVFLPLTIIVGWYGMNFQGMPEYDWRYGYLYVTILSLATILILCIVGKKKKWY